MGGVNGFVRRAGCFVDGDSDSVHGVKRSVRGDKGFVHSVRGFVRGDSESVRGVGGFVRAFERFVQRVKWLVYRIRGSVYLYLKA